MSNKVYANGRELACKAGAGKAIAAMPDVCMTPPQTPATPPGVPIPYPNNTQASDSDKGSKKVKISGKEVTLKGSNFKKSTGDEAGSAPMKGVVTQTNKGKGVPASNSQDVKIEGDNAVRHLDMQTNNHQGDAPGATPPWPFTDSQASGSETKCTAEKEKEKKACKEYKPNGEKDVCKEAGLAGPAIQRHSDAQAVPGKNYKTSQEWADDMSKNARADDCLNARRCQLVPHTPEGGDSKRDGINGCCPAQTPDHLIPASSFFKSSVKSGKLLDDWVDKYDPKAAPCMCAEGANNTSGTHGLRHSSHKALGIKNGTPRSFQEEKKDCAETANEVFKASGCTQACIEEQLENGHKKMGGDTSKDIKHSNCGSQLTKDEISAKAGTYEPDIPTSGIR